MVEGPTQTNSVVVAPETKEANVSAMSTAHNTPQVTVLPRRVATVISGSESPAFLDTTLASFRFEQE